MTTLRSARKPPSFRELASAYQRDLRRRFNNALAKRCADLKTDSSPHATMKACEDLTGRFSDLGANGAVWALSRMLRFRIFGPEHVIVMLEQVCSLPPRDSEPFFKRIHRSLSCLQRRDNPHARISFVDAFQHFEKILHRHGLAWATIEGWREQHWPKFSQILEALHKPTGGRESAVQAGQFDSNRRKH